MAHGFLCPSASLAIIAVAALFLTASTADSEERWGNSAQVDNRFVVGNWRRGSVDEPPNFEDTLTMFRQSHRAKNRELKESTPSTAILAPTNGRLGEGDRTSDRVGKEDDKWGNSAGEGLDNRFVVRNLDQRNKPTDVKEPPPVFPFRMLTDSESKAAVQSALLDGLDDCIYCHDGVTCIQNNR